jgi:hypothetical protein
MILEKFEARMKLIEGARTRPQGLMGAVDGRQLAGRLAGGKAELQGWRRSGPALNA